MRRWNVFPVLLLATAVGCGGKETPESGQPAAGAAAGDTAAAPTQTPAETPAPAQAEPTRQVATTPVRIPGVDEPWTPTQTGTVNPGMTRDSVIAVWGPPVAERTLGAWTYLYFRNGCEASCGTFDVVFLENGQVVNAIVRGPGHMYGGTSTSPAGQPARATPPGGSSGGPQG